MNLYNDVLAILSERISPLNAQSILQKAMGRIGLKDELDAKDLSKLIEALGPGCALFLGDDAPVLLKDIEQLATEDA